MSLRAAACRENQGMNLARLEAFLAFLAQRLSAPDYAEAEHLLHAAVCPVHAARRVREAGQS